MDFDEAIRERHSVRLYTDRAIEHGTVELLQKEISEVNERSGMSIRLVLDEPRAFGGLLMKSLVRFRNAVNYIAVSGPESDHLNADAGYYGEHLVLFAQTLGLGTCWAMMAGRRWSVEDLPKGHRNVILISVGYPEDPGVPHKSRPVSDVADLTDAPDWFAKGVEYAMLAPTAMNAQRFKFVRDGDSVKIVHGPGALAGIDSGIVKYHFECGAGRTSFTWAD